MKMFLDFVLSVRGWQVKWLSSAAYEALLRLRNALDPLYLLPSKCSDADILLGSMAALKHAGFERMTELVWLPRL